MTKYKNYNEAVLNEDNIVFETAAGYFYVKNRENTYSKIGDRTYCKFLSPAVDGEELRNLQVVALYTCRVPIYLHAFSWKEKVKNNWLGDKIWEHNPNVSTTKKKIYIAHPISNDYEVASSIQLASSLRSLGYEVYAAAENKSINDKKADVQPTPAMIFDADIAQIKSSDIMIVNLTGGHQDGTIMEVGYFLRMIEENPKLEIHAYSSNQRLLNPQHTTTGIASASMNHLVYGGIEKHGKFYGSLEELLQSFAKQN